MLPTKVLSIFGTRPDAIKMAPVVLELRRHPERFESLVVVTGQHREQLDQVLGAFEIVPDRDLAIMQHGQTLVQITTRALEGLDRALAELLPDVVLAQGDTTTTFVAALAAFYHKIPFAHVEAGLRTDDIYNPFPEEMNRRLAASIAAIHFPPTERARQNLLREGVPDERVVVTGNTGIDALLEIAKRPARFTDPELAEIAAKPDRLVLITAHRRENLGEPLRAICLAVADLSEKLPDCRFVYALHKNPAVRETARAVLAGKERVHLAEPPAYAEFVQLMKRASLILTDSGGVQEEAPSLGVPVLVLRTTTERPEGVAAGVAKLVGVKRERIVEEAFALLSDEEARSQMARGQNPYGDGRASERIRAALEAMFR